MVKVEPSTVLNLEDIKMRLRELQELVNQLKSSTVVRAKSLEKIQQERLFLQQQLIIIKSELEQSRGQSVLVVSEPRVIN
jgi:16S rRNA C1402 (ribose-2'-O) methylase RsmI